MQKCDVSEDKIKDCLYYVKGWCNKYAKMCDDVKNENNNIENEKNIKMSRL